MIFLPHRADDDCNLGTWAHPLSISSGWCSWKRQRGGQETHREPGRGAEAALNGCQGLPSRRYPVVVSVSAPRSQGKLGTAQSASWGESDRANARTELAGWGAGVRGFGSNECQRHSKEQAQLLDPNLTSQMTTPKCVLPLVLYSFERLERSRAMGRHHTTSWRLMQLHPALCARRSAAEVSTGKPT